MMDGKNISRTKSAEKVGKMGTVAVNYILPKELTFEETFFSYFLKFSFDDGMNTWKKDSQFSINVKSQYGLLAKYYLLTISL